MHDPLPLSRSVVRPSHALITPDSHVPGPVPGWEGAEVVVLISPNMGARFVQYLVTAAEAMPAPPAPPGVERFAYVLDGGVSFAGAQLGPGDYAYVPPDAGTQPQLTGPSRLVIIDRRYAPLPGCPIPAPVTGTASSVPAEPLHGDPGVRVRQLLPSDAAFDMAVNIMEFTPGAMLGFTEVHVMEHGLLMLAGRGVYRLDEHWYPVAAGDVIHMAPHCPQWFGALGTEDTRYLIYKDWNRMPEVP